MNITIIGSGNMAKGIATRLLDGGHSVALHARDEAKGLAVADELKAYAKDGAEIAAKAVGSPADDVVVLATPYAEIQAIAEQYDGFSGKTVIDITNPVDFATFQLIPAAGRAGAEDVAAWLPEAKVVKAFNTVFAGTLASGKVDGKPLDVFVAGDDDDAKKTVASLIVDGGLRSIDVGPLANARHLEGFALIHMAVQEQIDGNWMSALKLLTV